MKPVFIRVTKVLWITRFYYLLIVAIHLRLQGEDLCSPAGKFCTALVKNDVMLLSSSLFLFYPYLQWFERIQMYIPLGKGNNELILSKKFVNAEADITFNLSDGKLRPSRTSHVDPYN